MIQKLLNHQQMPRPFGMKAGRLNAVTKSLMVLLALLLFPQGTRALDYVAYDTNLSKFVKMSINASSDLIELTSTSPATTWVDGKTYYVTGSVDINDRIDVQGTVNLILCDGATLTANKGIALGENDYLNIYGQSAGTGQLTAIGQYFQGQSTYLDIHYSAIGYVKNNSIAQHTPSNYGYVNIYGGQITAFVPEDATDVDAIGGYSYKSCEVAIYGGNVTASGGSNASGINLTFLGDGVAYYGQDDGGTMSQITDETERHRYMNTKEAVYDLTIGGTQVRLTNAFNILNSENKDGDPTASFDGYNTLTLNDLQIDGNIICQLDDLIVNISGANTLCKTSGGTNGYIENNNKTDNIPLSLVFEKGSAGSTLELNAGNGQSVIQGFTSVTAGDGIYFQCANPFIYEDQKKQMVLASTSGFDTPIEKGFMVTTTPHYPIWMVNPTTPSSQQAHYNEASNSLKLNGLPFTVDNSGTNYTLTLDNQNLNGWHIVDNLENLTIALSGANTMNATNDTDPIIMSFIDNAKLSFTDTKSGTSNSLEMSNDPTSTYSIIYFFANVDEDNTLAWSSGSYDVNYQNFVNAPDLVHSATLATKVGGQTGGQTIEYDVWVAGTRVNSSNASNVLKATNNNGNATVQYDYANNKLTLDNASLNSFIETSMPDLKIHIIGNCEINSNFNCIKSTADNGKLTFTKDNTQGGRLVLSTKTPYAHTIIRGFKELDGVPLVTKEPYVLDNNQTGYYSLKHQLSSDSTGITYAVISDNTIYPLWVGIQQVTDGNKGNNALGFSYDENNKILTLNGADITAASTHSGYNYGIISGIDNLKINLTGNNQITCNGASDYAFKGYGYAQDITFTTNTTNPGSLSLKKIDNKDHWSDGFTNTIRENGLVIQNDEYDGNQYYISRLLVPTYYQLWVGGTQVNSINATNVLNATNNNGNATVKYDPINYILTLDGATIDVDGNGNDPGAYGIKSGLANLTVELKNESSITCRGYYDYAFEGTVANAQIAFQSTDHTGSLRLDVRDANRSFKNVTASYGNYCGIFAISSGYGVVSGVPFGYYITAHSWDGDGSATPYLINNLADLEAIATFVNVKHCSLRDISFRLENNITSTKTFTSIGLNSTCLFQGSFDGNGRTISGLNFEYGLFHFAGTGTIKNLTLDHCTTSTTTGTKNADYGIGILIGDARYSITVDNCKVLNSTITCTYSQISAVGGIAGVLSTYDSSVKNCVVQDLNMTITGMDASGSVGGIVGVQRDGSSITNCVVKSTAAGSTMIESNASRVGAIIGYPMNYNATGNTYDYNVTVVRNSGSSSGTTFNLTGYEQRGLGDRSTDEDGAALYTKKVVLPDDNSDFTIAGVSGTYYKQEANDNDIYVAPGQTANVVITPLGVKVPSTTSVSYTLSGTPTTVTPNKAASSYTYDFAMPDASATFTMNSCTNLESNSLSFEKISVDYTGADAVLPQKINLKNGTTTIQLDENTHYTIQGYKQSDKTTAMTENPKNAGTYYVTIKGDENNGYTGTVDVELEIKKITITAGFIDNIPDQTYNDGNAIKPKPTVTFNNNPLTENTDFEYEWANNINVPGENDPQPKVIVKGINNFEGTPEKTFKINKKAGSISFTTTSYNLTYGAQIFNNTVNNDGDGTVEYTSSDPNVAEVNLTTGDVTIKKAGDNITITATVKDGNNYTYPTKTATYTINVANANLSGVSASSYTGAYDGDEHSITVTAPAGATVEYCETQGGTYTLNAPKYKNYRATPYTVYYKVSQPNFNPVEGSAEVTITQRNIQDAIFDPAIADQTYDNGNAITPAFTVKFQNARTGQLETLQSGTDFENVVYENNTNVPGANDPLPKVTISGKGNFQGTKSTNFNILPATIAAVTVSIDGWTYGEATKSPSITQASNPGNANTVTYEYKISTEDDSKYSTTVPSNAETYVVRATVPATQNYQGASGTKVFTIAKADISNATFNPAIADQTYDNGNAIKPAFTVKFQNARTGQLETLQSDKDFENVVYENNTNVPGANDPLPKVTISGKGNFQGTKSTNFNILPATINTVEIDMKGWTYGGSAYNPSISAASNPGNATVTYEYKKQGAGDGTYSLTVPDAAGDYTLRATVPATQNYQGASATKDFTIAKADVNNVSISKIDALTYNGMAQAPKPDLYLGTKKLEETTDFTYGWANNTNAAQANANVAPTLTITGNGNFTGTRSVTFTINPATITDVTVDNTQFIYFPNDPKTVNVTEVKAGSLILGKNDYDVYDNVKTAVGNYTLSVKGKGNYTGTLTVDWRISERVVNIDFQGRTYRTFYNASETFLIPNDVKAYIVTGVSGNTATVKEVSYIPAGTPVLLESAPGAQTTVNANEVFTGNRLKYATGPNFNAQPYYYVLYSNEFVKATGDLSGKVYLDADGLPANARTLTISHDGDATAIDALFTEEGDGEQWFDMQGRRINKPTKAGLYIRNGKKVVIKK